MSKGIPETELSSPFLDEVFFDSHIEESRHINLPYGASQLESPFINEFEKLKSNLDIVDETELLKRETLDELELENTMSDEIDHYEKELDVVLEFESDLMEESHTKEPDWEEERGSFDDEFDLDEEDEYFLKDDEEAEEEFQPQEEQFSSLMHQEELEEDDEFDPDEESEYFLNEEDFEFEQEFQLQDGQLTSKEHHEEELERDDKFDIDEESEYFLNEEGFEAEEEFQPQEEKFTSKEHQSLGKMAIGLFEVNLSKNAKTPFKVYFGDLVALSGDYFKPFELMKLASIPGRRGSRKRSRDEIVYALYDINAQDKRFQSGGSWGDYMFSPGVKKNVSTREDRLAASNDYHFLAPWGKNSRGRVINKGSAIVSYLYYHKIAIYTAYKHGSKRFTYAMAIEASAHHFLTDAFSAGHIRTPVSLIRKYWGRKYPIFRFNLFRKIALDTAIKINDLDTNGATIFGSVKAIYKEIMSKIKKMEKELPKFSLGDLISLAFHDYDNTNGVVLSNGKKLYGDKKLSQMNSDSQALIIEALKAGIYDIKKASDLRKKGGELDKRELIKAIQKSSGAPTGKFLVEMKLPQADKSNPQQNWKARTFSDLWKQPMLGNSGITFGQYMENEVRNKNSSIRKKLEGIADNDGFDDKTIRKRGIYLGTLHPRTAYLKGFVEPLVKNLKKEIINIINWTPNYGLHNTHRDDITLETVKELIRKRRLNGMKFIGRVRYIKELIGGYVSSEEEEVVLKIFQTAPPFHRPLIYQRLEGHSWKGNWRHGFTIADDDLWNALSRSRLRTLRNLINNVVKKKH